MYNVTKQQRFMRPFCHENQRLTHGAEKTIKEKKQRRSENAIKSQDAAWLG